jgi:hypothetical protein
MNAVARWRGVPCEPWAGVCLARVEVHAVVGHVIVSLLLVKFPSRHCAGLWGGSAVSQDGAGQVPDARVLVGDLDDAAAMDEAGEAGGGDADSWMGVVEAEQLLGAPAQHGETRTVDAQQGVRVDLELMPVTFPEALRRRVAAHPPEPRLPVGYLRYGIFSQVVCGRFAAFRATQRSIIYEPAVGIWQPMVGE